MSHLHYACHFQIQAMDESFDWGALIRQIRTWLARKHQLDRAHPLCRSPLFYTGNQSPWQFLRHKPYTIETESFVGQGNEGSPEYWALRYRHPDMSTPEALPLYWTTDIVVQALQENVWNLRLRIQYELKHDQIIAEFPIPDPSVPSLIKYLISKQERWSCQAGENPLKYIPEKLESQLEVTQFVKRLFSEQRELPVVLICPNRAGETLIRADHWASPLMGVAHVVWLESWEAYQHLDNQILRAYDCRPGAVRIYLPQINRSDPYDYQRHRYIPASQLITPDQQEQTLKGVIRWLSRQAWRSQSEQVFVEDLKQLRLHKREQDLRHLKAQIQAEKTARPQKVEESSEYIQYLENEIEQSQQLIALYDQEAESYKAELQEQTNTIYQLQSKVSQYQYQVPQQVTEFQAIQHLQKLPANLPEMLHLFEYFCPQRLAFTERAKRSAQEAAFNTSRRLPDAWRLLWHMAFELHSLYFEQSGVDIERLFLEQTGFELTLKEGSQTRANSRLMEHRKDVWNHTDIFIEPHTKIGNSAPNLLRVYYDTLPEEKLIVIGHIGDHLPNVTTESKF